MSINFVVANVMYYYHNIIGFCYKLESISWPVRSCAPIPQFTYSCTIQPFSADSNEIVQVCEHGSSRQLALITK